MSAVLIAVILALVLGHAAPQLAGLRNYEWIRTWFAWLGSKLGTQGFHASRYGVLLSLGVPLLAIGLLQALLAERLYGLPAVAVAVGVLFYCWGPRDLDLDVDAVIAAGDVDARRNAAQGLLGPDREPRLDAPTLVEGVFTGGLERWFGVLFWFLLLGPFGALLYRITQYASTRAVASALPVEHADAYTRLKSILDWPVAHIMALGLALAADFDTVLSAWRTWHAERGQAWYSLDTGFLGAVACASVDMELAEEQDEAYAVEAAKPTTIALPALKDAMSLVWRILLLWLAGLALFVLAGFVN